jgi:hypothetical protein
MKILVTELYYKNEKRYRIHSGSCLIIYSMHFCYLIHPFYALVVSYRATVYSTTC